IANVATPTLITLNGGGSLVVNSTGATGHFIIAPESNTTPNNVTVDMSGIANFSYSNSAAEFRIAGGPGNGTGDRANATVTFAATSNTITSNIFTVGGGSNSNNNALATLHLGAGTNLVNANTILVAG